MVIIQAIVQKTSIILSKKSDNTGWIGKIPVELLLLVPNEKSHYKLDISPYIYLNKDEKVRTSSISPVDIYLLEQ
ncbi:hypothetical protein F7734_22900 [Scytonema sp. UIC 10036]|uniref:hypothetical protein n=1 Tax=Scytonema sp. UIC 10036 TaxID=2304196 RepID=UPI0012DA9978|nr:hypothetical protein [Scytonema sp. UIC 10036]MUG95056.1 hypothetical protein [Scytonema sp. UIC 10036]